MQDFLTPWEQQLADEINAMNLPVHVEVAPVPLPPDASLLPDSMLPGGVELVSGGEGFHATRGRCGPPLG